jgi:hypothetical protein
MEYFWVYSGYASPDHCDASEKPTYTLRRFNSAEQVVAARKQFEEDVDDEECSNVIFRVIRGRELDMKPRQIVTDWDFGEGRP